MNWHSIFLILSRPKSNLFLAVAFATKTHFSFIVTVWESRFTFCDFLSPFHMLVASQSNLFALVLDTTLLKSGKRIPEGRVTTASTLLVRKTKAFPKPSRLLLTPHRALPLSCPTRPPLLAFSAPAVYSSAGVTSGRFPTVCVCFSASGMSHTLRKTSSDHQAVGEEKGTAVWCSGSPGVRCLGHVTQFSEIPRVTELQSPGCQTADIFILSVLCSFCISFFLLSSCAAWTVLSQKFSTLHSRRELSL